MRRSRIHHAIIIALTLGTFLSLGVVGSAHAVPATPMNECVVSRPNHVSPPEWLDHYITEVGPSYSENEIWVVISDDGTMALSATREIKEDGPYKGWRETKMWWARGDGVKGTLYVTGRRLDAPAPAAVDVFLEGQIAGYGTSGFTPVGLAFPAAGCWEITGVAGTHSVTFTLLVTFPEFAPWETPPATPAS